MASRGDTRQRIQDVALELFAEKGYEKTSLREIAERLDVTKAALYYHFKTKEDILMALFQSLGAPLDELVEWGKRQPRTLEMKKELLARYSQALQGAAALFRFMQENQATIKDLSLGETFKNRMFAMVDLLRDEDGSLEDQVRCATALFSIHAGLFALKDMDATPEEKQKAVLTVAQELIVAAHHGA
ncbi:helix-turn-helix domain-containing protein [Streptomyces sp. NPDC051940]|uniref:TetR/AcrR family transcriptional regulator n=1 Tax=Streptomyces sp. NPDC051940 TaxID=3155675 RepID=UPI003438A815